MTSIRIEFAPLAKFLQKPLNTIMLRKEFDSEIQRYLFDRELVNYIAGGGQVVTLNDDIRKLCFALSGGRVIIIGDKILFTALSRYLRNGYAIVRNN
jgi:hypothetical protein